MDKMMGVAPILESYLSTPRNAKILARAIIASRSPTYDDVHQEQYFARTIRVIYEAARSYHRADAREIPLFTRVAPHSFLLENACKTNPRFGYNMTMRTIYRAGKNDIPLTGCLSCRHYHYVRGAICVGNIKSAIVAIGVLNQVFQEFPCYDSLRHIAHHADICGDAGRHASTNIMRTILETICQYARNEDEHKMFVDAYISGLCAKNRADEYAAMRQLLCAAGAPRDDYRDYAVALRYGSPDICELINLDHDAMIRAFEKIATDVYYCNVRGIRYAMNRSPEIARKITNTVMKARSSLLVSEEDERFALCWEHPANIAFWRGLSSLKKSKIYAAVNRKCKNMNPRVAMHIEQRWKDYCAKYS